MEHSPEARRARLVNGETYGGFTNPDGLVGDDLVSARLAHNGEWIREMMAQGRTIIDMGSAPGQANYPGVTSNSYSIELQEIEDASYKSVINVFDRLNPW